MKIIVSGGTGFIGRSLLRQLLGEGHEVTVITRDPRRARLRLPASCRCVAWSGADSVATALAGQDVVVHLAGESVAGGRWTPARKKEIVASRVDTSRTLVEAIAALPPNQRPRAMVAASAIGIYGDRGEEVLDEASAPGSGFLADVCVAWEGEVKRVESLGLRLAIVRIGVVLGHGGGALAQLLPLFRLGLGGRVGSGTQWFSWIHLDDMVGLLQRAATDESFRGVFNATAPEPVTNVDFTRALAAAVQRPAIFPVPAPVLRLALGEMAVVLLGGQRVEPRAPRAAGFAFRFPDLKSALADLAGSDEVVLEREQWFARRPEELFPFFSDAFNLEQITPALVHFRVLGTSTKEVASGTLINYRLRLHGLPLRWQSRIEEFRPPEMFTDSQVSGPYRLWHHSHTFEASGNGTLVRDRVRYRLPLGALGELVAGALVRRDLDTIFDFRHERLAEIFGEKRTAP